MSYNESIATGDKIISEFSHNRWVILCAQMQSGKTSVYTYVAEQMVGSMVGKAFVISALNDNFLRDQTIDRVGHIADVFFLPPITKMVKDGSMPSLIEMFRSSLIIIDESHIGANEGGILHRFLSMIGISANGKIDESLYDNDAPYVMSVSATPYTEVANITEHKRMIVHYPGPDYYGLNDMNLIHYNTVQDLPPILETMRDSKSYVIYRDVKESTIPSIVEDMGIPVIYCNMMTKNAVSDIVEESPDELTLVVVKMYARCGYTFSKKYVSIVWEVLNGSAGQAQGLPGRCCGYDGDDVSIYCTEDILEHQEWVNSDYAIDKVPHSTGGTMYECKDQDIEHDIVTHLYLDQDSSKEDILPYLYDNKGLVITHDEDDIPKIIASTKKDVLSSGEWQYYLSPSLDHLSSYLEERKNILPSLYTPYNQEDTVRHILRNMYEDHPSIKYIWPYKRSISQVK